MSTKKTARPLQRQQLSTGTLMTSDPVAIGRALGDIATATKAQDARIQDRVHVTVDLVVGDNRVAHGLGRPAIGATVTPTTADASFAWALTGGDSRQAVIAVVGVPQPRATVELF